MYKSPVCVVAVIASALSIPATADDTTLPSVVVTATRLDQNSEIGPSNAAIITAADIASSTATTLPDLLTTEAGLTTNDLFGNQAALATVGLRGFGITQTQNTLVLLNGRRLNDVDLAGVDLAAIPLRSIERIEIIRGGGAVLYGDGAVGGAINIVTRQATTRGSHAGIEARAASYRTRELSVDGSSATERAGLNVFADRITSDGYRDNNTLDRNNGLADLRLRGDRGEWFLTAGGDKQDLGLPGPRTVDPSTGIDQLGTDRRGTSTPNDYANQNGGFLTTGYSWFLSDQAELILDGGYRDKTQRAFYDDYAFGGLYSRYLKTDLATWSLTPRLSMRQGLFGAGSSIVGVDYYVSQYESNRTNNAANVDMPIHQLDIRQTSTAAYAETTSKVLRDLAVTLGARIQRVNAEASDNFNATAPGASSYDSGAPDMSESATEEMYDAGVRQALSDALSVFVKASRSVRFPTVDESYGYDPVTFAPMFLPLRPQIAHTYDLGLGYAKAGTRVSASLYRMNLRNEISLVPHYEFSPVLLTNDNLGPTKRYGAELMAETRATPTLRLRGNYTYTCAEFASGPFEGNEVPLVPRHLAAVTVLWDLRPAWSLATTLHYVSSKRFDNDQSNTFQKIPASETADVKLTYRKGPWRADAGINNIFNEQRFDYGVRSLSSITRYNAYPLPERSYTVDVRLDL